MKVLIAVASKHGSTREIAGAIAEEMRKSSIDTTIRDVGAVKSIDAYDAVILGSAIYAGSWLPDAQNFAKEYREALSKLPVWLFSSGPLGADTPQPQVNPDKIATSLGMVEVRDHCVFVGKLDPASLGVAERIMVRVVGAPAGDFRDWEDIRGWAQRIAAELCQESVATSALITTS